MKYLAVITIAILAEITIQRIETLWRSTQRAQREVALAIALMIFNLTLVVILIANFYGMPTPLNPIQVGLEIWQKTSGKR
jgi:hypothetical protein